MPNHITPEAWAKLMGKDPSLSPPKAPKKPTEPKQIDIRITKDRWAEMAGKPAWDVQVALRGPDVMSSDTIKWFTTAVVRYAMSKVIRVGGLVNSYLPMVVVPGIGYRAIAPPDTPSGPFAWDYSHFFHHVREAATHLGIPAVSSPAYWPAIQTGNINQASQILDESLRDQPGWQAYMKGNKVYW